jgi:hypothetical protein
MSPLLRAANSHAFHHWCAQEFIRDAQNRYQMFVPSPTQDDTSPFPIKHAFDSDQLTPCACPTLTIQFLPEGSSPVTIAAATSQPPNAPPRYPPQPACPHQVLPPPQDPPGEHPKLPQPPP